MLCRECPAALVRKTYSAVFSEAFNWNNVEFCGTKAKTPATSTPGTSGHDIYVIVAAVQALKLLTN